PDAIQDDLQVLSSALGWAADDYVFGVTPTIDVNASGTFYMARGVIETSTDIDTWRFNATSSSGKFTVRNWTQGGMLMPDVQLKTTSGAVVPSTVKVEGATVIIET